MSWCPLWAALCSYFDRTCPSLITCRFTNLDPSISARYDPSSATSYLDFQNCNNCSVQASTGVDFLPFGAKIPGGSNALSSISDILAPDESPNDMLAEDPPTTYATSAVTGVVVAGSIVGSLIAANTGGMTANAGYLGSGHSVIHAVALLLHFQSISTSGLLSISYPALYRFFSYNFAWANLVIAPSTFLNVVQKLGANPSCLSKLGSLQGPDLIDDSHSPSGMTVLGVRYGLSRAALGGLVYLSAIVGVGAVLVIFVLVDLVLRLLNFIFPSKLQDQIRKWPSRALSIILCLFVCVLGPVSTFSIYQFVDPCSTPPLIAFASIEFGLIILTLLIVSIRITRTAKSRGVEALFQLSESKENKYSLKWGSLYSLLKQNVYWYFIPDYVWVLSRSLIVGLGQGSGIAQVGCLIFLELIVLLTLLIKWPYDLPYDNGFNIFSAFKRLFTACIFLAFCPIFPIQTAIKRRLGIFLIFLESIYAVGLFAGLLYRSGKSIVKWCNGHHPELEEPTRASEEPNRASVSEVVSNMTTTTTTSPLVSPALHPNPADVESVNAVQAARDIASGNSVISENPI